MVTGVTVGTAGSEDGGMVRQEIWRERRRLDCDGGEESVGTKRNFGEGGGFLYRREGERLRAKGVIVNFKFCSRNKERKEVEHQFHFPPNRRTDSRSRIY